MFEFVIEEDGQEDGDADVGDTGTVPVDFCACEGRVVLACRDDDAHNQGQEGAEGEPRCLIGQVFQVFALGDIGPAEAEVADGDADPGDETGHAADVDQPVIGFAFADEGRQEGSQAEDDRCEQGIRRDAALVQFEKAFRGLSRFGHGVEHTRRDVEARVACRQDGGQNDGVHDGSGCGQAEAFKDQRERADGNVFDVRVEQVRVRVGDEEADDRKGA